MLLNLSETRDRSPRREKDTSFVQLNGPVKQSDNSLENKKEGMTDEHVQTTKIKKEDPVKYGIEEDHIQTTKVKKDDPVKQGLEELQRILPHIGSPGEEKV